jgi:hypothetical protein
MDTGVVRVIVQLEFDDATTEVLRQARSAGTFLGWDEFFTCAAWQLTTKLGIKVPRGVLEVAYRNGMRKLLETEGGKRHKEQGLSAGNAS